MSKTADSWLYQRLSMGLSLHRGLICKVLVCLEYSVVVFPCFSLRQEKILSENVDLNPLLMWQCPFQLSWKCIIMQNIPLQPDLSHCGGIYSTDLESIYILLPVWVFCTKNHSWCEKALGVLNLLAVQLCRYIRSIIAFQQRETWGKGRLLCSSLLRLAYLLCVSCDWQTCSNLLF